MDETIQTQHLLKDTLKGKIEVLEQGLSKIDALVAQVAALQAKVDDLGNQRDSYTGRKSGSRRRLRNGPQLTNIPRAYDAIE